MTEGKSEFDTRYQNWETWVIPGKNWWPMHDPWNFERQRLYKLLGIKIIKKIKKTYGGTYETGEYQITKTSANTYSVGKKTESYSVRDTYYIIGYDKDKITDLEKYEKLRETMELFLAEAEKKFPTKYNDRDKWENITPAYFNFKTRLKLRWKNELILFATSCLLILPAPIVLIKTILYHTTFNKKFSKYRPLASDYFDRLKEFEEEIKKICNFDNN